MNFQRFFPETIRQALTGNPPGAWMPTLPVGCIRLSAGYPAPELVPAELLGHAVTRLIAMEGSTPLQYLGSPSAAALPGLIRKRLSDRQMIVGEDELLITAGAFQALDLVARILLDREAVVVVEAPTYMEALEVFRNYTTQVVDIPVDQDGLCTDELAAWLHNQAADGRPMPRLVYTIASFHNPTGTTLSYERRKQLLKLAEDYDFLIIEDDAYGELYFSDPPPTLFSQDTHHRVIHVGSLSKVVAPGIRIGWAVGPNEIITAMGWFKKDLDHAFIEATTAVFLSDIAWADHLSVLRAAYRDRRDVLLDAVGTLLPSHVTWYVPSGGYFLWLHVPGHDTGALQHVALSAGVAYVPGKHFFTNPDDGRHFLRLSYSYLQSEQMVTGVERLARVLRTK